jgi:COP9 signalosome complex subunit 12
MSIGRAPLEESRKWGIYNIINLLFKTYFKLNSISLSKNILKAIQAYRGDMPPLDAFPKAHQVTFKYYVGVIYFLEENYVEVCNFSIQSIASSY